MQHQKLVDFLEKEAAKEGLSMAELSRKMGLNQNQLGNISRGVVPGLSVCLDVARHFDLKPDYVLFLAGHITEDELDAPEAIPVELLPLLHKLVQIKGTPFWDYALNMIEEVIEGVLKLFKIAA